MKKQVFTFAMICVIALNLMICAGVLAETENMGEAPDYSKAEYWYQIRRSPKTLTPSTFPLQNMSLQVLRKALPILRSSAIPM